MKRKGVVGKGGSAAAHAGMRRCTTGDASLHNGGCAAAQGGMRLCTRGGAPQQMGGSAAPQEGLHHCTRRYAPLYNSVSPVFPTRSHCPILDAN